MSKTIAGQPDYLLQKFIETIASVDHLEKRQVKVYQKLEKAAHTPELTKCLSPLSTDSAQHLQRLALIKLSIGKKNSIQGVELALPPIQLKKSSAEQDLNLIERALSLQSQKLGYYEFLHPMAKALKLDNEAQLIEQTITDNRNTNTWLRQIVQNIVVPTLLD